MKKLLVLALVLGMAALSNAGIFLTANGADVPEISVYPSDIVTIGVANDPAADQYNAVVILGIGDMNKGEWTGASAILKNIGDAQGWVRMFDEGLGMDAWVGYFAQPVTTSIPVGITGTVEFHCKAPGDVIITLTNDSLEFIDALVIHQLVPEPMTMLLLGLGGLFLRKR